MNNSYDSRCLSPFIPPPPRLKMLVSGIWEKKLLSDPQQQLKIKSYEWHRREPEEHLGMHSLMDAVFLISIACHPKSALCQEQFCVLHSL